jgi:predicted nucleic acid-binding protein
VTACLFADTSFWIALSSRRDQFHSSAVEWHGFVVRSGSKILTTEAVLWEWLNALSDPGSRGIAVEGYRRAHADHNIEIVPFQMDLSDSAVALYGARPDKGWSLADCFSFVVMERWHMTEALTTDRHFEQANLKALMLERPAG